VFGRFGIVVVVVGIGISSQSKIFSVGAACGNVVLLFVVLVSCIGFGIGLGGCIVVIVIVDDCCCSFFKSSVIRQRYCMLWMIWWLIASKSTGVIIVVVAVVVKGRLQHDVVLGSGGSVETRGGVIIVIGADRCAARNHLIVRCGKGNFSTSAAMVQ